MGFVIYSYLRGYLLIQLATEGGWGTIGHLLKKYDGLFFMYAQYRIDFILIIE